MDTPAPSPAAAFGTSVARACAGAILFGLPLLMTMEMWQLGFAMPSGKLALLLGLFFPVLVLLSWHAGFEPTFSWKDDTLDALVAFAVGMASSTLVLWLLGLLESGGSPREMIGKIALQAVPASIGALLAQSQLGERHAQAADARDGFAGRYASQLFIMGVGALFLAFNVAPTQEMLLIALRIGPQHALGIMAASLALMHAFVYSLQFRGGGGRHRRGASTGSLFLRFTVAGYALALLLSASLLWFFGTTDGLSLAVALRAIVVLGLPAALGAAAARLIL